MRHSRLFLTLLFSPRLPAAHLPTPRRLRPRHRRAPRHRPARTASICSSASAMWRWCSCMRTSSRRCRCGRRRWPGTSRRPRSPDATSSTISAIETGWRCGASSRRSSRIRRASISRRLAEIQRYTKLFWINSGPYNNLTARKFVLNTTPHAFAAAAQAAAKSGATFPAQPGESLDALLARLQPMFFDPNVDPDRHEQDARARERHPHGERQQPVLGRQHGGPERVHREVRP